MTLAWPRIEAGGQLAGFWSKTAAVQAFWIVVRRLGSCLGRLTLTLAMFA
jgi:hypothetical protein